MTLITRPIRCGPAAWARIDIPAGMIIPPPRPWRTRNTISDPAFHASPDRTEPATNRPTTIIHSRLAPKRSDAQPVIGITVASATRYPVATHWIVDSEACSSRLSVASATLTIVVSRIDMIAPITTTLATTMISRSSLPPARRPASLNWAALDSSGCFPEVACSISVTTLATPRRGG